MVKDQVRHARRYALSQDEVERIADRIDQSPKAGDYDKYIFLTLAYSGMRVNEFVHMRKGWVHIGDRKARELGEKIGIERLDHIEVPESGLPCDCRDCQLQAFYIMERKKLLPKKRFNAQWYKDKQIEFYDLSRDELKALNLSYEWSPKTESGHRRIPIIFDAPRIEIAGFFEEHDRLDMSRRVVWYRIRRISEYAADGRIIYPHVLRATCATLFAWKGLDATYLKNLMGWSSTAISDIYVRTEEHQMFKAVQGLLEMGI